jgi:hypothetical protein
MSPEPEPQKTPDSFKVTENDLAKKLNEVKGNPDANILYQTVKDTIIAQGELRQEDLQRLALQIKGVVGNLDAKAQLPEHLISGPGASDAMQNFLVKAELFSSVDLARMHRDFEKKQKPETPEKGAVRTEAKVEIVPVTAQELIRQIRIIDSKIGVNRAKASRNYNAQQMSPQGRTPQGRTALREGYAGLQAEMRELSVQRRDLIDQLKEQFGLDYQEVRLRETPVRGQVRDALGLNAEQRRAMSPQSPVESPDSRETTHERPLPRPSEGNVRTWARNMTDQRDAIQGNRFASENIHMRREADARAQNKAQDKPEGLPPSAPRTPERQQTAGRSRTESPRPNVPERTARRLDELAARQEELRTDIGQDKTAQKIIKEKGFPPENGNYYRDIKGNVLVAYEGGNGLLATIVDRNGNMRTEAFVDAAAMRREYPALPYANESVVGEPAVGRSALRTVSIDSPTRLVTIKIPRDVIPGGATVNIDSTNLRNTRSEGGDGREDLAKAGIRVVAEPWGDIHKFRIEFTRPGRYEVGAMDRRYATLHPVMQPIDVQDPTPTERMKKFQTVEKGVDQWVTIDPSISARRRDGELYQYLAHEDSAGIISLYSRSPDGSAYYKLNEPEHTWSRVRDVPSFLKNAGVGSPEEEKKKDKKRTEPPDVDKMIDDVRKLT